MTLPPDRPLFLSPALPHSRLAPRLSRRGFLGAAGAGALVPLLPRGAAAQAAGAAATPGAGPAAAAAAETIVAHGVSVFGDLKYPEGFAHLDYVNPQAPKGGEISEWLSGGYDTFNPYTLAGRPAALSTIVLETLLEGTSDETGAAYGLLAQSLEYPPSRDWVIFTLRPGVQFSDGTPLTSEDVVFSYEQLRTKGLSSFRTVIAEQIAACEALGPERVKFTFQPDYPRRDLIQAAGGLPVFSKADFAARGIDLEKSLDAPFLGSGPYRLGKSEAGRRLTWERNPQWWARDLPLMRGRYNFDRLRIEYYGDYQAAFEGFKVGDYTFRNEASSIIWATGYDFPALKKGHVVKEQLPDGKIPSGQCFVINLRRAQFTDIRVRRAIGMMFNFEWANAALFYGLYARVTSFWNNSPMEATGVPSPEERALLEPVAEHLPAGILTDAAVLPPVSGDRQLDRGNMRAASALLEEAGWAIGQDGVARNAEGKTLRVEILNDSQTFDRVINPFVENLRRIGIDAVHSRVDDAQYEERRQRHDYDLITTHLGQDPIAGADLQQYFGSGAVKDVFNAMGLANPGIDRLVRNVIEARTRAEMELNARVLDRALRALVFWVPQWYNAHYNVAYYDIFARPPALPAYALGEMDFWWYDAAKAETLKAAGAL